MKKTILLLLLVSLSFAGEAWKVDSGSAVENQPLVYGSRVVVGTSEGRVYSIEPPFIKWSYNLGERVVSSPISFDGKIIVPSPSKITALTTSGGLAWEIDLPGVKSVSASDKIYVADDNGIQALNSDGTIAWNFMPGSEDTEGAPPEDLAPGQFITRPLATPSYVIFGYNGYVYAIRTSGTFFWKQQVGNIWDAPPTLVANTLYTGTSEGIIYGLGMFNGEIRTQTNLFEQITTTPIEHNGNIIVGTSENHLYSVTGEDVEWSLELDGMVNSNMVLAPSAQGDILYLTTKKSLYAVEPEEGNILFKRTFLDWPGSPALFNNQVVLGTQDAKVYGIDSSQACSILYPAPDSQIGDAELMISGLAFSRYESLSAQLRINGEEWNELNGTEWSYSLNPSEYPYGIMEVECRVSDSSGTENEPYSKISLVHVEDDTEAIMTITYPSSVRADTEFNITVVDEQGGPISNVEVTAAGNTFTGNGEVIVSLPSGNQEVVVERPGYRTEMFNIDSKGEPMLAYVLGVVFLAGLAAYIYLLFMKKKKKKYIIEEKHPEQ